MQEQLHQSDYLIFNLTDKLYGVDARLVRETVRLPEITPMEDAPGFILGVINLRGRVVPVLDLNCRLGRLPQAYYRLSDSVVILEQSGIFLGLIVNEVLQVTRLGQTDIETIPSFEEFEPRRYRFIQNIAKLDESLVMLLAPHHLLHVYPSEPIAEDEDNGHEGMADGSESLTPRRRFNPEGGEETSKIFRERARRLMQQSEQHLFEEMVSLAIVRLNDEVLGVDLTVASGFAKARQVIPIPCCPSYIAGSMNLRGDILTLVDIRQILGLATDDNTSGDMGKVVVVQTGKFEVGVLVHEVVDIIHLRRTEQVAAPTAASSLRKEHLQGAIPYHGKMVGILNLRAILANPALLVNEHV